MVEDIDVRQTGRSSARGMEILVDSKFTPQVPGPQSMLRLATLALLNTSAPTEGNQKHPD
jgi:hypothetical protein